MTKEQLSTKIKILETSHKLFADKGLKGVSIRELAQAAGVNVAAVNYHFKTKEGLYIETIKTSMLAMSTDIGLISEEDKDGSAIDLCLKVFDYFLTNKNHLKTGFKLFLNSDIFPEDVNSRDDQIGPPGSSYIFDRIKKEQPNATDQDVVWGVRVIFTAIIHSSILFCSECTKSARETSGLTEKSYRDGLERLIRITLTEIKDIKHPLK